MTMVILNFVLSTINFVVSFILFTLTVLALWNGFSFTIYGVIHMRNKPIAHYFRRNKK